MRFGCAVAACALLAACGGPASKSGDAGPQSAAQPLASVDYGHWRDVGDGKRQVSLAFMCAGGLDMLEAADPSLKSRVALELPAGVQVSRKGKLQAQCVWKGPDQRTGRVVVDVLCSDDDNERCYRFAYATEGDRRMDPVTIHHHPQPPISNAYPPGRDEPERSRSQAILSWARDNAPDQMGALRADFRATKVGIIGDAKKPWVCGEVREPAGAWHRFAIYSIGADATPPGTWKYFWLREPKDKGVHDFCDVTQEDLQWYAVPDTALNGG